MKKNKKKIEIHLNSIISIENTNYASKNYNKNKFKFICKSTISLNIIIYKI